MTDISTLPTYEMNSFARWVAKATLKYFENPDIEKIFIGNIFKSPFF